MPRTVLDLIAGKPPVCIAADHSVRETAQIMLDKVIGAVLVMDGTTLQGIFTERDALRIFVATRRNPDLTNVGTVMTKDPITITPDTTIEQARQLMLSKNFRHLPVLDNGTVLGVVSLRGIASEVA
ncbi:MAG TPA: CBS domain-containing protein [Patescibacteria group bacterium]|nr:CBS domain-containing protein [Patescibacteria group bacterium]